MIGDIAVCFLLQIVFTIGIIILFGFLIALCNKRFYANFGNYGRAVCYITGAIGTPVHECAHALFCLIFGHKVTEIKLFQINSADGTLGYVNHSYNKKNIYHNIGNFFIGVAPIIIISAILYLLAWLLLPNFVAEISGSMQVNDFIGNLGKVFTDLFGVLTSFFLYCLNWQWWVFVIVGMFLALHMTLSKADIKGALSGILFLLIAVILVDIILGLVSRNLLAGFTRGVLQVGSYLLCILVLALIISTIALIVSFVFRSIKRKLL